MLSKVTIFKNRSKTWTLLNGYIVNIQKYKVAKKVKQIRKQVRKINIRMIHFFLTAEGWLRDDTPVSLFLRFMGKVGIKLVSFKVSFLILGSVSHTRSSLLTTVCLSLIQGNLTQQPETTQPKLASYCNIPLRRCLLQMWALAHSAPPEHRHRFKTTI